ncbi:MAG: creatininase family protein [Devosia sp.]
MAAFRKLWWADFTAAEFDGIDPMRTIAVLPTAAIEQHGPHLPVGVDTFLNRGPLDMLTKRLPADLDVRFLPVQTVGKSNEHIWQKGTISSTAHTLIDLWFEIGQSVSRAGVKKLVIVNSHGGNVSIIDIVARELRVREEMLVVKTAWSSFATPDGLVGDVEKRHGIHAGDVETSEMLHFQPDLVDMTKADDFASIAARDEQQFRHLRPTGPHAYGWIASDLNPSGAVGNAANATAERGRLIAEAQVAGMIELLAEVAAIPLPGTR